MPIVLTSIPQRLGEAERLIEAVLGCARKFRSTPDELPVLSSAGRRGSRYSAESADIAALERRVAAARKQYEVLAKDLSKRRSRPLARWVLRSAG